MSIETTYPFFTSARLLARVDDYDRGAADINDHLRGYGVTLRRTQACEHDHLSEREQRIARLRSCQRQYMFRKRIERRLAKLRQKYPDHQNTL